jgi:hypothetical protein
LAAWLVLDWDQDQFHILSAQSSRRGVQITQAISWPHSEPLIASSADRVGKALRDFLKSQKFASAPVIVGIGRDRIFLKELRFPPIAAHEEASLVRFQTGKEMAEAVDNYAVDYAHLANDNTERHVMTVAVRRDIIATLQTLCQSAGLKLHAVTPRLFGVAQVLARSIQPEASSLTAKQLNVVLLIGQRWAELCCFQGERLLQSQALANGPLLAGEVKRNLAVFQAQHAASVDLTGPDVLYVFGGDAKTLLNLETSQSMPMRSLDPLKQEPDVAATVKNPADFAGAVGLAALWSIETSRPVNLASPKRQSAPVSVTRQRLTLYGAVAAAALIFVIGCMWYTLSNKRAQIAALTTQRLEQESFLTANAQERAELDAYKDWEQSTVPWLDEMYDLTARFPFKQGFRVNEFGASTTGSKKNAKDGFVGRITLKGITPKTQDPKFTVYALQTALASDSHLRPGIDGITKGTDYSMKIDIAKQDVKRYDTHLVVPPRPKAAVADPSISSDEKQDAEQVLPPQDKKKVVPDDEGGDQ